MTLKFAVLFLAFAIASVAGERTVSSSGPGGWETGGGDISALQFVKMGRELGEEMLSGSPACSKLRHTIDPAKFLRSVENARVSSTNGTPINTPGAIQFNRRSWYNISRETELFQVFHGYSVNALAHDVQADEASVWKCLPSTRRLNMFGHIFEEPYGDNETFVKDVHQASANLKKIVLAHSKELGDWSIPTSKLLEVIDKIETGEKDFVLSASSTPIHFKSGEIKDGKNAKDGSSLYLSLNEPLWIRSDNATKVELLFHECLGLTGVDDSRYQYSSRIWKFAPARLYVML
jgi:hypothetical protein